MIAAWIGSNHITEVNTVLGLVCWLFCGFCLARDKISALLGYRALGGLISILEVIFPIEEG